MSDFVSPGHRLSVAHARPGFARKPLALATLCGLAFAPMHGLAATILVMTPGDTGTTMTCTLRQAVFAMNNSTVSGSGCTHAGGFGANDTIGFDAALGANPTITLTDATTSVLSISKSLTIDGSASGRVTIERPAGAANNFALITHTGAATTSLTLIGLNLRNGANAIGDYSIPAAGVSTTYASLSMSNSSVTGCNGNRAGGVYAGGAITLTNTTISNNAGKFVTGGVGTSGIAAIALTNSVVSGNSSQYSSGGVNSYKGAITLVGTTVSGNSSTNSNMGSGGGIGTQSGSISLTNSTISGNTAFSGGGIFVYSMGCAFTGCTSGNTIVFNNSTIAGNTAVSASGGGVFFGTINANNVSVALNSTLISGNMLNGGTGSGSAGDIARQYGSVMIGGANNLVRNLPMNADGITFANVPLTADPLLQALASNGGPTQTQALGQGSPAIDKGNNVAGLATDQRGTGYPRAVGAAADIGAFETAPVAVNGVCGTANGTPFAPNSPPTSSNNLCAVGTASSISGSGPWTWQCTGSGGTTADCAAPVLAGINLTAANSTINPATSSVYGESVTLTLSISGAANPATGTALFCDGGTPLASGAVPATLSCANGSSVVCANASVSNGVATCTVPLAALGAGPHAFGAAYSGDANTASAVTASNLNFIVSPAQTTTTIGAISPNPVLLVDPNINPTPASATVPVTVAPVSPGAGAPTGTVTVTETYTSSTNATTTTTCQFTLASADNGAGSCVVTPQTPAGPHSATAVFAPDATGNFTASSSTPGIMGVLMYTSTAINNAPATVAYGELINSLQIHVYGQKPTGAISVFDGGNPISCLQGSSVGMDPGGNFYCELRFTSLGTHNLTVTYPGDSANQGSTSVVYPIVVVKDDTSTDLASDASTPSLGQAVTLTASVKANWNGALTGTVKFVEDGNTLCDNATLIAPPLGQYTYTATCPWVASAGQHAFVASYSGDVSTNASASGELDLTVAKAMPQITWPVPGSITYGTTLSATQLNATATYNATPVAGTFTYTPAAGTLLPVGSQNLSVSFVPSDGINFATPAAFTRTILVVPAALTITAANQTKTYGDAFTFAGTEFTASGLQNGETIGSVTLTSAGTATTAGVGGSPYPIAISNPSGSTFNASNYSITYTSGQFAVERKTLTVTADDKSRAYAAADPAFTWTPSGFVNGDTATVLSGAPALSSSDTPTSAVGTAYPITIALGTLAAANYQFTFVNGTLTISDKATQTIAFATPPAQVLVSGSFSINPAASSGLPMTMVSNSTSVCAVDDVGPFTITLLGMGDCSLTASQAGDANYGAATPVTVSFSVGKAASNIAITNTNPSGVMNLGQSVTINVSVTATSTPAAAAMFANVHSATPSVNVLPGAAPSALPLPTGTVTITDITGTPGTCTLTLTNGIGSCAITPTVAGSNTIQAVYNGDASYAASVQPAIVTLAVALTTPPVPAPILNRWTLLLLGGLIGVIAFVRARAQV